MAGTPARGENIRPDRRACTAPSIPLLTSTFTACSLLSHFFYVVCAGWMKRKVRQSAARSRFTKRTTGALFIGMGGALLTVK